LLRRSLLGLWRLRLGAGDAEVDPQLELGGVFPAVPVDVDRPPYGSAGHAGLPRVRPGESVLMEVGAYLHHQVLAPDAAAHVARHEKADPAEHLLFGQAFGPRQLLADLFGQFLAVRHVTIEARPVPRGG